MLGHSARPTHQSVKTVGSTKTNAKAATRASSKLECKLRAHLCSKQSTQTTNFNNTASISPSAFAHAPDYPTQSTTHAMSHHCAATGGKIAHASYGRPRAAKVGAKPSAACDTLGPSDSPNPLPHQPMKQLAVRFGGFHLDNIL